jgi:hypothetical protein
MNQGCATISREPGQAWKGAATAVDSCAEVRLVGLPPLPVLKYSFRSDQLQSDTKNNIKYVFYTENYYETKESCRELDICLSICSMKMY